MAQTNVTTGSMLRETREHRNLTIARLAKLSGVSRRHISIAERGENISLGILKKLMAALQLTEITVGDFAVSGVIEGVNPMLLLDSLALIDTGLATIQRAVEDLRTLAEESSPSVNVEAANLVRDISRKISTLDKKSLAALQPTITQLLASQTSDPRASRRTKRSA